MNNKDNFVQRLIKLYESYKKIGVLSANEFIDKVIKEEEVILSKSDINNFFGIIKHEAFIEKITRDLIGKCFLSNENEINIKIVIYLVIFVLNDENMDTLLEHFIDLNCFYLGHIILTIADSNQHLFLCELACKQFEDEYVLEKIIYPLLNKKEILFCLAQKYEKLSAVEKKASTQQKPFEGLQRHMKKIPPPPSNTPTKHYKFKAFPVPKSTKRKSLDIQKKIDKVKAENRKRAQKLLEQASKMSERLTQAKKVSETYPEDKSFNSFTQKPMPVCTNVEIKTNLTVTLREASRLFKNQEEEIKKIEDLVKGGFSNEKIANIEKEFRKEQERYELEAIERKHLEGLLLYEDAILAKQNLLQANKEKMEEFKKEKIKLVEALDKWREEEETKIKALVEKSHNIKSGFKESKEKMLQYKQAQVKLQQKETKKLLDQALKERMNELTRKAEIINEIKALHQVRCSIKEFDFTETPNLGLLCEMSIAELQERLAITKINMQRELEEKRQKILKDREERRQMIANIKQFILKSRKVPKATKMTRNRQTEIPESSDLIKLKQLLDEKRQLRISLQ